MEVLSIVILDLGDQSLIVPLIQDMGKRHVGYGTQREHYNIVGQALIQTLEEVTKGDWSDHEKSLWIQLYSHIADLMIEAAQSVSD